MRDGELRYRTAVVTGVSSGLGLAVANAFANLGLGVVGASRTEPPPESGFDWCRADIAVDDDVQRLFEFARKRHGDVDVLVNNAGGGWVQRFEDSDPKALRELVDVNLTGQILCTHAAVTQMLERERGLIINVASDWARRYAPEAAVYAATKFGLLGFSGSLLREVKDRGVKVVCVMPGAIDTGWGGAAVGSREAHTAMPPADLAQVIAGLLKLPEHLLVHEIVAHPIRQPDF